MTNKTSLLTHHLPMPAIAGHSLHRQPETLCLELSINKLYLASIMLGMNARIAIIVKETNLKTDFLRQEYRKMHNHSPPSGPLRTSPQFLYKSSRMLKEATLCAVFLQIESPCHTPFRAIGSYEKYRSFINATSKKNPLLNFSDLWVISTWLQGGILQLSRCGNCRSAKLLTDDDHKNICAVCRK